MEWNVYADLARPLTSEEQGRIFAALDAIHEDSGCVGPNRSGIYEVFFTVTAATEAEARVAAAGIMAAVLERAQVSVTFVLELALR